MEQMQYNLLFRWFVGLGIADAVWVPTVFSKNRDRLLTTDIAQKFLAVILAHREITPLLSDEHFSVDSTLIKAWASVKSFQPKPEQEAAEPGDGGPHDPPAPPPSAEAEPTETKPEPAPHRNPEPEMPRLTSGARSARTRPTLRSPIRRRGFTRNLPAPARSCVS